MKIVSPNMRKITKIGLGIALSALVLGCGGSSNNDQGISVTLLGFNIDPETGRPCADTEPNHSGSITALSTPSDSAGGVLSGYVVQNRMTTQFYRTENAFLEFYIPGAAAQPPSTAVATGGVVDRAPVQEGEGESDDEGSRICIGGYVLPPEIQSWIINNRNSMPEPPFQVEVRAYISGVTASGDRLDTNVLKFFIEFTQDIFVDSDGQGSGDSGIDGGGSTDSESSDTGSTDGSGDSGSTDGTGSEGTGDGATDSGSGTTDDGL